MSAKNEIWCAEDRVELARVLPLETPISVSFGPSSYCNLKCNFCVHGLKEKPFVQHMMELSVFEQAAMSLKNFPNKIKNVVFSLVGEPTMNPDLPGMIACLKRLGVAEEITMFTNGILLTPELGEKLIDSGLTRLRVSIEGVSDERYEELCGVKVQYQKIVENVAAFYAYKSKKCPEQVSVFVKTFDQSLPGKEDQDKFFRDFDNICDQISIETIAPLRQEVDYHEQNITTEKNVFNQATGRVDVCTQPFYAMYVHSTGDVSPCCVDLSNIVIGNVRTEGLDAIWKGEKLRAFQKQQLSRKRYRHPVCKTCEYPSYGLQMKDQVDHVADKLFLKMFPEGDTQP